MKKKEKKELSLVLRAEREGIKGTKTFEAPGKYALGYKLAQKMKSQTRIFFIEHCRLTAPESRKFFYDQFIIDWENPYRLEW